MKPDIYDLRSAIEFLKFIPGEYAETDVEIDPCCEITGVYRYLGAGAAVKRPTKKGPALMFNNIKDHPGARCFIGGLGSRERTAKILGTTPEEISYFLKDCAENPIWPVEVPRSEAKQTVTHYATEPDFHILKYVPAAQATPEDSGPFITQGLCYANDPVTGESDVTIHRMCIQDKDTISFYIVPGGRHIGAFFEKACELNEPLMMSVNIGLDPAIYVGSCFEPPTTPIGYNELGVAGAIRQKPVEITDCPSIKQKCIANAEFVIEAMLLPNETIAEDSVTHTGKAMPEFPGYTGPALPKLCKMKVISVSYRESPIMQTIIGPSEEHTSLCGLPTEASIIKMIDTALPGRLKNVYVCSCGVGKLMAILQVNKRMKSDEGRQKQMALLAFAAFSELKQIILVDDDVDPFDYEDVLWAMTTRFEADKDIVTIPGIRCHPLDPSQTPEYNMLLEDVGCTCKTIFDCTVPYRLKNKFERAKFIDLDPKKWFPDL